MNSRTVVGLIVGAGIVLVYAGVRFYRMLTEPWARLG